MTKLQLLIISLLVITVAAVCTVSRSLPKPEDALIARGRELFFNEKFAGNGRTCGTCHPAENNFTIDPAFIATLPDSNALFVAEFNPDLKENFENPRLMRQFGLILENLDGFDDLANKFARRGVPHVQGLRNTVASNAGPHTGWSGDGAPGDGSLRSFATGAVIQHFTKTLNRIPGVDFRLPTDAELDALEAFMLSLGPKEELKLPLPLKNPVALRGQALFNDPKTGKCFICHFNAGANANPGFFGQGAGNLNFNTGVEDLPDQPARHTNEKIPIDDGLGAPGNGTFNTPSLIEAADTGPFFHNGSVFTIEGAVGFYDGETFNNSPAGRKLDSLTGSEIELDATQIEAISIFLREINALENIRQSTDFLNSFISRRFSGNEIFDSLPTRAGDETEDAIRVLNANALHFVVIARLQNAYAAIQKVITGQTDRTQNAQIALNELSLARKEISE